MGERNLDFDQVIDRRNTKCLKYDFAVRRGKPADILPLWVADMDFRISSYIQDALAKQVEHGIYGYSESDESYYEAFRGYMERRFGLHIDSNRWIVKTPTVVFALGIAVQAFSDPGDGILIQQPVYYPFSEVIEDNGRRIVDNTLLLGEDGRYRIDLEDFERKIVEEHVKLFLLCNPHNPTGRVFTKEELTAMGDICYRHGVIVVSDEIHAEFVWSAHPHTPFLSLKEEYKEIALIATSASKAFNIAGLHNANIIIPNQQLRRKFRKKTVSVGISQVSGPGLVGAEAAYRHGDEWIDAAKRYIRANIDFARAYLKEQIPQLRLVEPEGTYLLWIDCSGLGLNNEEIDDLVIHKAGLWLDSGAIFGKAGDRFQRINVACPRVTLEEALRRLKDAVYTLG